MMGLLRAFLAAGAGKVMASLWPVSDEHTLALMTELHARLATGSPRAALRAAVEAMRRVDDDPFTWAPFALYGRADRPPAGPPPERAPADPRHGERPVPAGRSRPQPPLVVGWPGGTI
jgi:hypothetical protein